MNRERCAGVSILRSSLCHNAQACNVPQYSQLALRLLYGNRWAEAEGASAALGEREENLSLSAAN